jgi:hypothetical protein
MKPEDDLANAMAWIKRHPFVLIGAAVLIVVGALVVFA